MSRFRGLGETAITPPAQANYYEEAGALILDVTLTANQEKLGQGVFIEADSDFRLEAISGSATGAYQLRIQTPSGRYWPQTYGNSANLVGSAGFPVPIEPPMVFPAGAKISIDIKDTSGAGNTVQLVFRGARLFKVS